MVTYFAGQFLAYSDSLIEFQRYLISVNFMYVKLGSTLGRPNVKLENTDTYSYPPPLHFLALSSNILLLLALFVFKFAPTPIIKKIVFYLKLKLIINTVY